MLWMTMYINLLIFWEYYLEFMMTQSLYCAMYLVCLSCNNLDNEQFTCDSLRLVSI